MITFPHVTLAGGTLALHGGVAFILRRYSGVRLRSLVAVFRNTDAYLHTNKTHTNEHELEDFLAFPEVNMLCPEPYDDGK